MPTQFLAREEGIPQLEYCHTVDIWGRVSAVGILHPCVLEYRHSSRRGWISGTWDRSENELSLRIHEGLSHQNSSETYQPSQRIPTQLLARETWDLTNLLFCLIIRPLDTEREVLVAREAYNRHHLCLLQNTEQCIQACAIVHDDGDGDLLESYHALSLFFSYSWCLYDKAKHDSNDKLWHTWRQECCKPWAARIRPFFCHKFEHPFYWTSTFLLIKRKQ